MTAPDPRKFHPNSRYSIPAMTLHQGAEYVPAIWTDIRATFARVRASSAPKTALVIPAKRWK